MALSILGIGPVTALGCGRPSLQRALNNDIKPNIEIENIPAREGIIPLPVYKPVMEGLDRYIDKRALRRIDYFAQMALLSAYLAIEDASLEFTDKSRVGVIFGSGYGPTRTTFKFLDNIIDDGDFGASPTYFANSVHNALASQVSIFLKLTGPCSTVTCFEHTLSNVLITAQNWLEEDTVDYVLAGLGDEYCHVLGYAATTMGAGESAKLEPLDLERCTFLPGEGHITFVLGRKQKSRYPAFQDIKIRQNADAINSNTAWQNRPVILGASGRKDQSTSFKNLDLSLLRPDVYGHLFGSMPVGSAFDIAMAALSADDQGALCIEYCDRDAFNCYVLNRS